MATFLAVVVAVEDCNVPLFTVVVPTYNRADELARVLDSLRGQTFGDFEVVVVDDGSTVGDVEQVVTAVGDPRFRSVRQPNGGGNVARNTGAAASTGRFLTFLDDDDEAMPNWLETIATLVADPACAVASCGALYVDLERDRTKVLVPEDRWTDDNSQVARFDTGMFFVRRDAFDAAGRYAPGLPSGVHNELALRLLPLCAAQGWTVRSVPDPLIRVNQRQAQTRSRNYPGNRYAGATYVLEQHAEWLADHPKKRARLLKAAGVNAARLGRYGEARRLLLRAVRATPTDPWALARVAVACVPPLSRRVWRTESYEAAQKHA